MTKNVVCIDDTCRPNEIPASHWVRYGEEYTVIEISSGINGAIVKLAEIDLTQFLPYMGFSPHRFAPVVTDREIETAL